MAAAVYVAKNNAYSTLAGALTDVGTTLTVQTGHGDRFPVITAGVNYTFVTLEDASNNIEIVKVTARASASDSLTIERAQESTTARAWSIGDVVECRPTAGVVNDKASLTENNNFAGGQNFARATVASHATTADIWSATGNQIDWTGTATTTAFPNAPQAGAERTLICAAACSFTAGANLLIDGVTSGDTVTLAANDTVVVRALSTTQFKLTIQPYGAHNESRATVASHATTADIWGARGNQINWTGTETTTAFPAAPRPGAKRELICAGACAFTAGANMLIDGVSSGNTVTCAANDIVTVRAITTTQFRLTLTKYDGSAQVANPKQPIVSRSSNTMLGASDIGKRIEMTGTWTQTFDDAGTLGADWWVDLYNDGTGDITLDPYSTQQIDGLTSFVMYPGEVRRVGVNAGATALESVVLRPFKRDVSSTETLTTPPGYQLFGVSLLGAGGQGGSGAKGMAATSVQGGGGGGGGAFVQRIISASLFGTTALATIGAGGSGGGASQTASNTAGNAGAVGGNTSIALAASTVYAYGGGGGSGGTTGANSHTGGSGGGSAGAGGAGGGSRVFGGRPRLGSSTDRSAVGEAGASAEISAGNGNAQFGGASGGGHPASFVAFDGGSSILGGAGGGTGGSLDAEAAVNIGSAGGSSNSFTNGGGGAAASEGATGTAGAAPTGISKAGTGGGGGGASSAMNGGAGGAGGRGCGGGGGGACDSAHNSGAGGVGGNGYIEFWGVA